MNGVAQERDGLVVVPIPVADDLEGRVTKAPIRRPGGSGDGLECRRTLEFPQCADRRGGHSCVSRSGQSHDGRKRSRIPADAQDPQGVYHCLTARAAQQVEEWWNIRDAQCDQPALGALADRTQRTEEAFRQSFHCGAPRHTRKKDTVSRADHRTAIERLLKQRHRPRANRYQRVADVVPRISCRILESAYQQSDRAVIAQVTQRLDGLACKLLAAAQCVAQLLRQHAGSSLALGVERSSCRLANGRALGRQQTRERSHLQDGCGFTKHQPRDDVVIVAQRTVDHLVGPGDEIGTVNFGDRLFCACPYAFIGIREQRVEGLGIGPPAEIVHGMDERQANVR